MSYFVCVNQSQAWASVSHSLGSNNGLQTFMNVISQHYVRVCNEVVVSQPRKKLTDLRVIIDEKQYKVDIKIAPKLFVEAWNEACTDQEHAITQAESQIRDSLFKWKYFWCIGPLIQACRYSFAAAIRKQFDVVSTSKPYISDKVLHSTSPDSSTSEC